MVTVFVIYSNVEFWKKKFALRTTKKINILTLVVSEKKILNETKNHNPPVQVKWSVPNTKWNSSPISRDWHSWHSLLCLYTFVQRPTSIGNLWLDVLNLQKINLFLSFKTSKYFSNLKSDLNNVNMYFLTTV